MFHSLFLQSRNISFSSFLIEVKHSETLDKPSAQFLHRILVEKGRSVSIGKLSAQELFAVAKNQQLSAHNEDPNCHSAAQVPQVLANAKEPQQAVSTKMLCAPCLSDFAVPLLLRSHSDEPSLPPAFWERLQPPRIKNTNEKIIVRKIRKHQRILGEVAT